MIALTDFKNYYKANQYFLEMLKERNSIVYDRLSDVIKVINYVVSLYNKKKTLDDDNIVIFETGFSYFHEELEIIKIYYNEYFHKDYLEFKKYEDIINFLLYIEDFTEALAQKNLLDDTRKKTLDTLSKKLENILIQKSSFTEKDIEDFNLTVESCIPHNTEILTTDYIFSLILEEIECRPK